MTKSPPPLKLNRPPRPKLKRRQIRSTEGLNEDDRHEKCLELLAELGIEVYSDSNGELTFSCPLDNGMHRRGDRNPSFGLNWRRPGGPLFYCHGCGEHGGFVELVMTTTGRSRDAAWTFILDGVSPHSPSYVAPRRYEPQSRHEVSELEPFYVRRHSYLRERGLPEANLVKHEVGYDPVSTRIVIPVFEIETITNKATDRVTTQRNLLGWQTRRIMESDGTPKYLTSKGLKIGQVLYNADRFHDPDRWRGLLGTVVVESPLSVVAKSHLDEVGYGFVATFGAPSKTQLRLLANLYDPVILWFDSDPAGVQDTLSAGEALQGKTNVYVVVNPYQVDVDELPDETVIDLLEEAIPYAEWKQRQVQNPVLPDRAVS